MGLAYSLADYPSPHSQPDHAPVAGTGAARHYSGPVHSPGRAPADMLTWQQKAWAQLARWEKAQEANRDATPEETARLNWLATLPPLDVDRSGDIPLNRPELMRKVRP